MVFFHGHMFVHLQYLFLLPPFSRSCFFLHRNDLLRVAEVQRVCTETATCLTQVPRVEETEDRARAQRRRLSGDLFI